MLNKQFIKLVCWFLVMLTHYKTLFPERYLSEIIYKSGYALYEGRELIFNAFRILIFRIKEKEGKRIKILTPKQMLQRLSIALVQVKPNNTSENLLNEIRKIIYSLYQETVQLTQ